jgi:uncharacterized protein YnzC (UPF0291/DUF896 family)
MSNGQAAEQDPEAEYSKLNPQQRTTIAEEFIRGFKKSGESHAEPLAAIDPKKVTPQQLAAMHQHARDEHPDVLGRAMRNSIVAVLLSGFGAREIDTYVLKR